MKTEASCDSVLELELDEGVGDHTVSQCLGGDEVTTLHLERDSPVFCDLRLTDSHLVHDPHGHGQSRVGNISDVRDDWETIHSYLRTKI